MGQTTMMSARVRQLQEPGGGIGSSMLFAAEPEKRSRADTGSDGDPSTACVARRCRCARCKSRKIRRSGAGARCGEAVPGVRGPVGKLRNKLRTFRWDPRLPFCEAALRQ